MVPGVLRDFDLPDLARAIAPRTLWLVDPRTPAGAAVSPGYAAEQYKTTAGDNFRVVERPEGWPLEKVYGDWMRR